MFDKDIITIITRDPDFSKLQEGTLDKIKNDFKRIFGGGITEATKE